jgi:hypothetical protein
MWGCHGVQVAYESMVIMNVTTRDKFFYEVFLYYNPLFLMVSNMQFLCLCLLCLNKYAMTLQ